MNYLLVIIALFYVSGVHAEVYKWVDESGAVHYGDKPTSGSQEVQVQQQEKPSAAMKETTETRDEKRQRIADMLEEDRIDKNKKEEKKKYERERKKRECNRLKDHQRHVENAGGLYKLDKDGNRVFMSKEQRDKSEQALRKRIQKNCS